MFIPKRKMSPRKMINWNTKVVLLKQKQTKKLEKVKTPVLLTQKIMQSAKFNENDVSLSVGPVLSTSAMKNLYKVLLMLFIDRV